MREVGGRMLALRCGMALGRFGWGGILVDGMDGVLE